MWTNEIDALFRMACEEFNNEPSFRDIQDDARFKDFAEFWLFDEPFFNVCFAYFYYFRLFTDWLFFIIVLITDYFLKQLEVQHYKTEQAQLAAAEKLSADAATVKVIFLSILFLLLIFI
jgi:hypothetical protein